MNITMTATYTDIFWEDVPPDTEPPMEHGWTDPSNPWGGWKITTAETNTLGFTLPDGERGSSEEIRDYIDTTVEKVTFSSAWEAAEFVADFPGGVWDLWEGEYSTVDYRTAQEREVTLHVDGDRTATVFELATTIQAMKDRRLRAYNDRITARRNAA